MTGERREAASRFHVGVDLGQRRDPTALAVIEQAQLLGEFDHAVWAYRKEETLYLRHLDRLELGTPYTEVVEQVVKVTNHPTLAGRSYLAVDGTGVGVPVVDILRGAGPQATMLPVLVTGGQTESYDSGFYKVPKRDLIIGLQLALQQRRLQIAAGMRYGMTLVEELAGMEVRVTAAGNEQFAAWREGTHDDLVFAVALAYWSANKVSRERRRDRDRWWTGEDQAEMGQLLRRKF